jgi:hypothetical protein
MIFPPVVERELRLALRKHQALKSRFRVALIAGGVVGVALFFGLIGLSFTGHGLHEILFLGGVYLAVIPPARISVGLFCEERRNQTLELLFLTGMGPGGLFTGKLLGGVLIASGELLALIPFMAVPFLSGGLSLDLFWASLACFPVLLLFTVAMGVLASVLSRDDGAALVIMVVLAGAICLAVPLPYYLGQVVAGAPPFSADWLCLSPAYGPYLVAYNFAGVKPAVFWRAAEITLVWGLGGLALAAALLRRTWREEVSRTAPAGWRGKWNTWIRGSKAWRAGLRERLLQGDATWKTKETEPSWHEALREYKEAQGSKMTDGEASWFAAFRDEMFPGSAFRWLAEQDRRPVLLAWAVIGGAVLLWLLGWWAWPRAWPSPVNLFLTALLLASATSWIRTYAAAKAIGLARREGALELLLTTPLRPREMVEGQTAALRAQFRPVRLALFGLFALMMLGGFMTRAWNERAVISYVLIWCLFLGWCLYESPGAAPRAMWVALNTGRPTFSVFHFQGWSRWNLFWMIFNLRNMWGGLTSARKFPSGSVLELVITVSIFVFCVIMVAVVEQTPRETRALLISDMRVIAREPVPDRHDPRFKNWSGHNRLPVPWTERPSLGDRTRAP